MGSTAPSWSHTSLGMKLPLAEMATLLLGFISGNPRNPAGETLPHVQVRTPSGASPLPADLHPVSTQ